MAKPSFQKAALFFYTLMSQIHYFNPGHETAVLLGKRNYTPPTNVRKMQKDLAILPVWYANDGDYVFAHEHIDPECLAHVPEVLRPHVKIVCEENFAKVASSFPSLEATPWGLSPQSLYVFERLAKKTKVNLSVRDWKEDYFRLTGRQTAALCLAHIKSLLPNDLIPEPPCFYSDIESIERHIASQRPPYVLKTPYSSSGRGLAWIKDQQLDNQTKNWIIGAINKQGTISVEKGLEKTQDFAMEFLSDGKGNVRYEGLSVFNTEERGAYTGNILEDQHIMLQRITKYVDSTLFHRIKEAVRDVLANVYGNIYAGCIGVDMIVYRTNDGYAIHPCIEINMRYTMGLVALRLFQKLVASTSTGLYQVTFEKDANEAFRKHQEMSEKYPLNLADNKIKSGYLSLCPIDKGTNYSAYILVKE